MMILVDDYDRATVRAAVSDFLSRQAEVATALRTFAATFEPPELDGAPFLRTWVVAHGAVPCLAGLTEDHPMLKGPAVLTSPVLLLSPAGGWARTESRWYRLGHRAGVLQ